jgi:hypothetical protein
LHLEGKRFWGLLKKLVGSGLISTFKWTMHPLNIKPFMTPDTFPADSTRFATVPPPPRPTRQPFRGGFQCR